MLLLPLMPLLLLLMLPLLKFLPLPQLPRVRPLQLPMPPLLLPILLPVRLLQLLMLLLQPPLLLHNNPYLYLYIRKKAGYTVSCFLFFRSANNLHERPTFRKARKALSFQTALF